MYDQPFERFMLLWLAICACDPLQPLFELRPLFLLVPIFVIAAKDVELKVTAVELSDIFLNCLGRRAQSWLRFFIQLGAA